jgi:hypothetical protein
MNNISKNIFELNLGIMKNTLKLMEFKFGGRDSDQFKFVKEQIMNFHYDAIKRFFLDGVKEGAFEKCSCGANLRQGWRNCICAGSGFKDSKKN